MKFESFIYPCSNIDEFLICLFFVVHLNSHVNLSYLTALINKYSKT